MSPRTKFWASFARITNPETGESSLSLVQMYRTQVPTPTKDGGVLVEFEVELPDVVFEPLVTLATKATFPNDGEAAKMSLQAIEKKLGHD